MNILKTRRGKLENKIKEELKKKEPKIENILSAVEIFEKNNLDTIEKLKRTKRYDMNKINGALKSTIDAHGPITKPLIGSAGKRIYGSLLEPPKSSMVLKILTLLLQVCLIALAIGFVIKTIYL